MGLVYGNLILVLCVITELGYLHFARKTTIDLREVTANINSGHILLFIFRSLSLTVYFYAWENLNTGLVSAWPQWLTWLFAFLAWDFCFYWSHRLHHYFSALWFVHRVHHEGEQFNLSLGLRNSWYSTLTSMPFFLFLAFAGIPLEIFVSISAIHYFIQFLNHSYFKGRIPLLEYVFITPASHHIHHGKNEPYRDKNFGGTFIVWDRLFKTFQEEQAEIPVEYGVSDPVQSSNPWVINHAEIFKKRQSSHRFSQQKIFYPVSGFQITSGCCLLLGLLFYYLYREHDMGTAEKLFLFLLVFTGTIANGGLADGLKWGILLWVFVSIMMCGFYIFLFSGTIIRNIFMVLWILHGIWIILSQKPIKKSGAYSDMAS